jgi:hypothetical protein
MDSRNSRNLTRIDISARSRNLTKPDTRGGDLWITLSKLSSYPRLEDVSGSFCGVEDMFWVSILTDPDGFFPGFADPPMLDMP